MNFDDNTQPRYFLPEAWTNSPLRIARTYGKCFYNGAEYRVDPQTDELCRDDVASVRGVVPARVGRSGPRKKI